MCASTTAVNKGKSGGDRMVDAAIIGEVIRTCRERKGLSQEVLSGLAGLDRTHYSKIERGLRSPTISTFFKIAQALDMPPHKLMEELEAAAGESSSR